VKNSSHLFKKYQNTIIFSAVVFVYAVFAAFTLVQSYNYNVENSASQIDELYVNEKDVYSFLILGTDNAAGLCDMMLLVSLNVSNNSANAVWIPRDTYVEFGSRHTRKINGVLNYFGGDALKTVDFFEKNLDIEIDYYAVIDLDVLVTVVDLLGGIEIDVPFDMVYEDVYQNLKINLSKGTHILSGKEAEQFVRYRSGYIEGDIGRIDAQKIFIAALADDILSGIPLSKMINLCVTVLPQIKTNVGVSDCLFFLDNLRNLNKSEIYLSTIPGKEIYTRNAWYYAVCKTGTEKILSEVFEDFDIAFDRYGIFVDTDDDLMGTDISNIYYGDNEAKRIAIKDINENGIYIGRLKK
jgi:LCP family protein required for cell wall assembly